MLRELESGSISRSRHCLSPDAEVDIGAPTARFFGDVESLVIDVCANNPSGIIRQNQGPNPKGRSRGRGGSNGKKPTPIRNGSYDNNNNNNSQQSRGRGNANQLMDKFLALARDASLQGDRVLAESYFQYADHYFRQMAAAAPVNNRGERPNGGQTPAQPGGDAQRAEDMAAATDEGDNGNDSDGDNGDGDNGDGDNGDNDDSENGDVNEGDDGQPL